MGIDYARRTEMASMSKEVRELYFAALATIEAFDQNAFELNTGEADALYRLSEAVEAFQGEELTHGSDD